MPTTTNDIALELAKRGPELLQGLGLLLTAAGTLWAAIASTRANKHAKEGKDAAQQSVDETVRGINITLAQNQEIAAVKQAVSQPSAPPVVVAPVVVEAPTPPSGPM